MVRILAAVGEDIRRRAAGAIVGLAIGDALGAPFRSLRRDGVPSPLPQLHGAGVGGDATAMARNLWSSLIADRGVLVLPDVLARHLAWFETGPPDVGAQTRLALEEARRGTPEAARAVFERRGPEVSAGNGSVMYCAPLGVARAGDPERLFAEAPGLSRLTHWDERCATACLAVTLAVAALVRGEDPPAVVTGAVGAVGGREGADELEHLVDEAGRSRPIDGPDRGFALFTAGIALQVAGEGFGFEEGLRHVVGLGGDTDTNAAVAGALLGARHGRGAIPSAWFDRLAQGEPIDAEARALASLVA